MQFCPLWILGIVSAHATESYIAKDVPLDAYAIKYSRILGNQYSDTTTKKLKLICEEMMLFLIEIQAEDLSDLFNSYIYFMTTFDERGEPRKIKTFFKNALAPVNAEATVAEVMKSFKVFTFKYRSNDVLTVPVDWQVSDVEKISWLGDLFDEEITYRDGFDLS
ncbi:hypothetical protein GN278_15705 [Rhodobacteraceae bacterium Araon29]